jgi:hypothetical protein
MTMNYLSNITRSEGDPRIVRSGPSSANSADRLARALGWFSIGLGLAELIAPRSITTALGMEGKEGLVRAYGAREVASGILSLSTEKQLGLWSRIGGDSLDIAALCNEMRHDNPKRDNVRLALAMVLGVAALDLIGAKAVSARHAPRSDGARDYGDRSGFPQGVLAARGAANDLKLPERKSPPALPAHT